MAAMRLNIPAVFVSGGPMEAGKVILEDGTAKKARPDRRHGAGRRPNTTPTRTSPDIERSACPTCGSCSGMFTANSMNCLDRGAGPGAARQWLDARHPCLPQGAVPRSRPHHRRTHPPLLRAGRRHAPRRAASPTSRAFENAMVLDIAMGGSTNTVLHLLAVAHEGEVHFTMADIDRLSRRVPHLSKVAPSTSRCAHGGRASRRRHHGDAGRTRPGRPDPPRPADRALTRPSAMRIDRWDIMRAALRRRAATSTSAAPGGVRTVRRSAQSAAGTASTPTARKAASAIGAHAYTKDGGLAVLYGNIAPDGCIVKTAGVRSRCLNFKARRGCSRARIRR